MTFGLTSEYEFKISDLNTIFKHFRCILFVDKRKALKCKQVDYNSMSQSATNRFLSEQI